MDYLTFRANAKSGFSILKPKDKFPPNHWSMDDIEKWIRREYERLYGKDKARN